MLVTHTHVHTYLKNQDGWRPSKRSYKLCWIIFWRCLNHHHLHPLLNQRTSFIKAKSRLFKTDGFGVSKINIIIFKYLCITSEKHYNWYYISSGIIYRVEGGGGSRIKGFLLTNLIFFITYLYALGIGYHPCSEFLL